MATQYYSKKLSDERKGKQSQSLPIVYRPQADEVDEGGLDLGQLLAALRRRAYVVASVSAAVASAAVAVALVSTPTYEARFDVLTQPGTVENKLLSSVPESLNDNSTKNQQPSNASDDQTQQIFVLQSPQLMLPIFKQIEAQYPGTDFTKLGKKIKIEPIKQTNILEVTYQDPDPGKVKFVLDILSKAYLKYSLDERQADVRLGIQFVEAQLPKLQQRVEILQEQLKKFRQQHGIIDPASQSQQLATQLNGVVQQQIDTQTQLARTRALYAVLQSQLQLKAHEATVAPALSEDPRYQSLLNQIQEIEAKIAVESARLNTNNPTLQTLREQRQNLLPLLVKEEQHTVGSRQVSIESRGLASPNSLRAQQIQQFFDAARQIKAFEAQKQALAQSESVLRQQVKQFPVLVLQNDDLERKLKIAVDNLNQFLTKREALRIDTAQKQVPWQLVTPPTKPEASTASIRLNLVLGITLGLLLGIGGALLVDKFKNIFYTSEEVKDATKLPLLGEIPLVAGTAGLIGLAGSKLSQQHDASHFQEALRSLHTNIRFLSFNSPVRSLALLSAVSNEGRSTIAVHLSQTAAAMGQRVLLVDADLRNPKIHTMLDLPNTKGLSNIIAEDLDFKSVVQRVTCVSSQSQKHSPPDIASYKELPSEDILFVLTAGQVPPNPTSLLSSQKMQDLAGQFESSYDLIIYDTSPLLGVADSSLMAAHADASILVVGLGKTDRSILSKVLDGLKISSTQVLGVVANGTKD